MPRIRIKNFGPVQSTSHCPDGWIDIKKVIVFIGNQGTGKSTVAKLISSFTWIEKILTRGDFDLKWLERKNRLKNQVLVYHRLENYFSNGNTSVDYEGDSYNISYSNGNLSIVAKNNIYELPRIVYIPAERNFISYVKSPKELKLSSDSLKDFLAEFEKAKNNLKGKMLLPVDNVFADYDKLNDTLNIGNQKFKIKITDASSGFQSLVPLYLVTAFSADMVKNKAENSSSPMSSKEKERFKKEVEAIWSDENLSQEQKKVALSVLSSRFNKTAFVNIVEEPEQNLFPESQEGVLYSLLKYNNQTDANKLIMTTHSPYIISYLSIAVQAAYLYKKINNHPSRLSIQEKLFQIVPTESMIDADSLAIYQIDNDGYVEQLDAIKGIPSDQNYLNTFLHASNEKFGELIELEQNL